MSDYINGSILAFLFHHFIKVKNSYFLLNQGEARGNQSELDIADIPNHIALQLKVIQIDL